MGSGRYYVGTIHHHRQHLWRERAQGTLPILPANFNQYPSLVDPCPQRGNLGVTQRTAIKIIQYDDIKALQCSSLGGHGRRIKGGGSGRTGLVRQGNAAQWIKICIHICE